MREYWRERKHYKELSVTNPDQMTAEEQAMASEFMHYFVEKEDRMKRVAAAVALSVTTVAVVFGLVAVSTVEPEELEEELY